MTASLYKSCGWTDCESGWLLLGIEQSEFSTCVLRNKMYTTAVIIFVHYTYWLFSLCNSLIGYEYIFTHMRIQREQNTCIGGKMRFVVHRAVKETFIARKWMKPAWNIKESLINKVE